MAAVAERLCCGSAAVGCDYDAAYLQLGGRSDLVFDCRVRIREAGGCILHWEQSDAPEEESPIRLSYA